jgi:hypothetical protein
LLIVGAFSLIVFPWGGGLLYYHLIFAQIERESIFFMQTGAVSIRLEW